ncbi:MAG: hypothetical protein B0A82_07765 [Alkalinema sp. CACIAM 70d]|nr:MAG: hypothetical protein B0A82_07765 [Alkalinema sp. CACIAM 70d]
MLFLLNAQNVIEYLLEVGVCKPTDLINWQAYPKDSKNFNLQVDYSGNSLLVKQECCKPNSQPKGDFLHEVVLSQLFQSYPSLEIVRSLVPEILHFDAENSILVLPYFKHHQDLNQFYKQSQYFPPHIAAAVAKALATVHQITLDQQDYRDFLRHHSQFAMDQPIKQGIDRWGKLDPEALGTMTQDAIKFFMLYQRYASLEEAITSVQHAFTPCCLTHNDLKLDNLLLNLECLQDSCEQPVLPLSSAERSSRQDPVIRLIDWEQWSWGDPAFDVGTLLASYLRIWLNSIPINTVMNMDTALGFAVYPLEVLQPSMVLLIQTYCQQFPEILQKFPDFLVRVMQFMGLALIQRIETNLRYFLPFDNTKICMLQVAKTLLCRPEESIAIIFGTTASSLISLSPIPA